MGLITKKPAQLKRLTRLLELDIYLLLRLYFAEVVLAFVVRMHDAAKSGFLVLRPKHETYKKKNRRKF